MGVWETGRNPVWPGRRNRTIARWVEDVILRMAIDETFAVEPRFLGGTGF